MEGQCCWGQAYLAEGLGGHDAVQSFWSLSWSTGGRAEGAHAGSMTQAGGGCCMSLLPVPSHTLLLSPQEQVEPL